MQRNSGRLRTCTGTLGCSCPRHHQHDTLGSGRIPKSLCSCTTRHRRTQPHQHNPSWPDAAGSTSPPSQAHHNHAHLCPHLSNPPSTTTTTNTSAATPRNVAHRPHLRQCWRSSAAPGPRTCRWQTPPCRPGCCAAAAGGWCAAGGQCPPWPHGPAGSGPRGRPGSGSRQAQHLACVALWACVGVEGVTFRLCLWCWVAKSFRH